MVKKAEVLKTLLSNSSRLMGTSRSCHLSSSGKCESMNSSGSVRK